MTTLNDIGGSFNIAISLQDAFRRALSGAMAEGLGEAVGAMGASLSNVAAARPLFLEANEKIGLAMQASVLKSYDQVVTGRKQFDSYRVDEEPGENSKYQFGRFGGGKLRHALQSDDMVVATPQGIAFINEETLDREAAHWHRLNFGAGNAGGKSAPVVPWRFAGHTIGVLSLSDKASAPFRMPHGIWSDGEGGLEPGFYPRSSALNVLTKGIQARRFLDAGLVRFAADAPLIYEDLLFQFVDQAVYHNRGPLKGGTFSATAIISSL